MREKGKNEDKKEKIHQKKRRFYDWMLRSKAFFKKEKLKKKKRKKKFAL